MFMKRAKYLLFKNALAKLKWALGNHAPHILVSKAPSQVRTQLRSITMAMMSQTGDYMYFPQLAWCDFDTNLKKGTDWLEFQGC